ncbi:MAG: hypothetical protein RI922_1271 [Bacteroidota bacterium]
MKRLIVILGLIFFGNIASAQVGLSGGVNLLKGFGTPKPFVGLHFGVEVPRDDQNSIFGRVSFYGKQQEEYKSSTFVTALSTSTNPYSKTIGYRNSMNYTILEGGNRYYIGDGYDSGFGGYGGGTVMVIFNSVKRKYDDYDQTLYALPTTELPKGSIFNVGFGLNGGLKYTFAGIGSIYGDASFGYMILGQASNATASSTNLYSNLIFTFNIGFRKELY